MSKTKQCRICGNKYFGEPLLKFENMPAAAQYLPDKETLAHDKGVRLEVHQCSGCGLVQLNNEPVSYYREVIRAVAFSREMKEFREKQFSEFVERYYLKGKKVIEIGCGRGEYLSIMQEAGAEAFGLEGANESVKECTGNGLKVTKGFVEKETYRIDHAPFSAFFMMSYLEHLPDPNATLAGIRNNLEDGAFGLVEVPNFDMIFKNKLFSEFISDHLFYFTGETLKRTLETSGFEVLECKDIWHDYIISAVVKKRTKLDPADFYARQDKIRKELNDYADRYRSVAIWGAGHQALSVIALADLAGKIKYVVDSAPFKQGKYTPATHLPIVAPDKLKSDPVDAVIIIAGSYSDEVAKDLLQKQGSKMSIAILRDYGLEKGDKGWQN